MRQTTKILLVWAYCYFSSFPSSSLLAQTMPQSWYRLPEDGWVQRNTSFAWEHPSKEFEEKVVELIKTQGGSFDYFLRESRMDKKLNSNWSLHSIRSQLALSSRGKLGILALKGSVATELRWFNSSHKNIEFQEEVPESINARLSSRSTEQEIDRTLRSIAEIAYRSGRVSNKYRMFEGLREAIYLVREMIQSAPDTSSLYWSPEKFRLKMTFSSSGQVMPELSAGGHVNIRFDWLIFPNHQKVSKKLRSKTQQSYNDLVKGFCEDMGIYLRQEPMGSGWAVKNFQVIVGMSGSGDVGIAKAGAAVSGRLYFIPNLTLLADSKRTLIEMSGSRYFNFIASQNDRHLEEFAVDNNIHFEKGKRDPRRTPDTVYRIDRSRFRTGLIKAHKISRFFVKHANNNRQAKWNLGEVRTDFALSIGGSIGVATISRLSELRIEFRKKEWF